MTSTKLPKVITVFGREVRMRGDIDHRDKWGSLNDAIGKCDGMKVSVARSCTGGFLVRIEIGGLCHWMWASNRDLKKAIARAERLLLSRLVAQESGCRAAREIVGSR